MIEESVKFTVPKSVFYNPQMHFCRSFASLAVGAIPEKITVCDAFCASGIRGIRYAKENKNVGRVTFIDIEKQAISAARKNAKANKIEFETKHGNFSRLVFDTVADFLEIDPFGSPAPYLYDAFRVFNPLKRAYLSVTATDVAVLCGGKTKACKKNYHAIPLNNEFTHETGLRIMIKKIAETAAEFNMGIQPLVSISKQHYLKTILKVERGAERADKTLNQLGYINYCKSCGWRGSSQFPVSSCQNCKKKIQFAGLLWLGELHDKKFLKQMIKLNRTQNTEHRDTVHRTLDRMLDEISLPPYYYDIHHLARLFHCSSVPKLETIISRLKTKGYKTARTHFSDTSIKTEAPLKTIKRSLK